MKPKYIGEQPELDKIDMLNDRYKESSCRIEQEKIIKEIALLCDKIIREGGDVNINF